MNTNGTKKYYPGLLASFGFLFVCVMTGFFSTSLQGVEKHYEIRPEITVPEYKTDTSRLIDSYEKLMNNYMRLAERNSTGPQTNMAEITKKIDLLDQKITALSAQIATIQKKLGIETPSAPVTSKKPSDHPKPEKKSTDQ